VQFLKKNSKSLTENKKGRKIFSYHTKNLRPMLSTIGVLGLIFAKISIANKSQRTFLEELFTLLPSMRGRFNFCNLARYSTYNEVTFRRHYSKCFNWLDFNYTMIQLALECTKSQVIVAIDASFISKAGKKTFGIDRFWSGCANATKRGLEISTLALIEVATRTAWTLDVTQTPAGLSGKEGQAGNYTRINFYIEQILDCLHLLENVVYFVADGYYAKVKMFNTMLAINKHLITKLRPDANMKYQLDPTKKNHGNKKYGEKVNWKDLDLTKWIEVGPHPNQKHIQIYTQELYSVQFKVYLKVVVLWNTKKNKTVLLASTNVYQSALEIVEFYCLRFQIEFLFRDAKQFTGLTHCQARDEQKLDFHFNMSLAAINLYHLEMKLNGQNNRSMNSFIRKEYNTRLVRLLFNQLNSEAELGEFLDIQHPLVEKIINLGQVTYKKTG